MEVRLRPTICSTSLRLRNRFMRTLLAGYRVEVPALTPAGHALELHSLRGPAWTDILVSREKDQSLRTEWAYIRRFARRWRSCPPCPCPCLRRGHRSLLGSPSPASWCLSAFCCPPVAPNPCLHPRRLLPFAAVRSIGRLPLLGGEARRRSRPRPGRRCAASCWIVVSSIAPCRRLIPAGAEFPEETLSEMLVSASGKQYPVPRDTTVPCLKALLTLS